MEERTEAEEFFILLPMIGDSLTKKNRKKIKSVMMSRKILPKMVIIKKQTQR
jgi:hypothetical protein